MNRFCTYISTLFFVACASNKPVMVEKLDIVKKPIPKVVDKNELIWQDFYLSYKNNLNVLQSKINSSNVPLKKIEAINSARIKFANGDLSEATSILKAYLGQNPDADVLLELVEFHSAYSNTEECSSLLFYLKTNFVEALSYAQSFRYRYLLAKVLFLKDKKIESREILTSLLRDNEKFELGYLLLSETFLSPSGYFLSREVLFNALDKGVKTSSIYNQIGLVALESEKFSEAIGYLMQALKLDPNSVSARINLGMTYFKLQDFERAEGLFKEATTHNPKYWRGHFALGILNHRKNNLKEALKNYKLALNLDKANPYIRYNYGLLLVEEKATKSMGLKYLFEVTQLTQKDSKLRILAKAKLDRMNNTGLSRVSIVK